MNLAKKSTVLLAALSVFALTACGPKEKKVSRDEALAFAEEHFKEKDDRDVKHTTVSWNYNGNKPTGKTTSAWGDMKDLDINDLSAVALTDMGDVKAEDAKNKVGNNIVVEGSSVVGDSWSEDVFTKSKIASNFEEGDDAEFYLVGNEMKIVVTYDKKEMNKIKYEETYIIPTLEITEKMTLLIGEDGFLKRFDDELTSTDVKAYLVIEQTGKKVDGSECQLGGANFTITNIPSVE